MALVATVGGFNTNSYVTASEADTYFTGRYDTSNWDALTTSDKEALLIQSSKDVDFGNYYGDRYYAAQSLQFPRDDADVVEGNCASVSARSFKHSDLKSDTYGEIPTNYWKYGSVHFTSATLENNVCVIASSNTSGFVYGSYSATPTTNTEFIVFPPIDSEIKEAVYEQAHYILEHKLEEYAELQALGISRLSIGDVSVQTAGGGSSSRTTPVMCLRAKKLMSRYFRTGLAIGRA